MIRTKHVVCCDFFTTPRGLGLVFTRDRIEVIGLKGILPTSGCAVPPVSVAPKFLELKLQFCHFNPAHKCKNPAHKRKKDRARPQPAT